MEITRDTFSTKGQWNKFCKIKTLFEKLIQLKEEGFFFLVDDEMYTEPFIDGYELGFKQDNFSLLFVGATHDWNKHTKQFDIPWVDVTLKELRERIVPLKRATIKF